jgi:hypothetical protein
MGEILGLGMSHFPGMRAPVTGRTTLGALNRPDVPAEMKDPKNWPAAMQAQWSDDEGAAHVLQHRHDFIDQCRVVRKALDAFNPDFVLCWGDDQYENFKEDIIPAFCVFAYEDMDVHPYHPEVDRINPGAAISAFGRPTDRPAPPNAWGEPEDTVFHIRGKREAAKYLARGLLNEKVDTAYAYRPLHYNGLAHAFLNTVMFLDWDRKGFDYPFVTMQVNCYGSHVIVNRGGTFPIGKIDIPEGDLDPPGPSPERCMEVGAAVARVLKRSPWRVAVVASSSWSHAFLVPKNYFLYPDVDSDRRMYDALARGDYEAWRRVPNAQVEENGWQELRNWWCLVGAMEELGHKTPAQHAFLESYLMNSNKCFATWEPR